MYRLIVNYHHPEDPEAFLTHYRQTHAPIAKGLAKLLSYTWGQGESPDGSTPPYFLVAVLDWATKEDALADLGSDVGAQATADMANFAQAGATLVGYEAETVV